jgi:hypothetical protein
MKRALLVLTLSLVAFVAGAEPALTVSEPWVREPNPARPIGAAFMTIANDGDEAVTLVGASSSAAEIVEIHEMKTVDGVMKMRMIESLEIPAHASVKLEPGGYHLMLINLTGKLQTGDVVKIELKLDAERTVTVEAPVKKMEMHH